MADERLDAALKMAAERARLFTTDTLAGEYVAGWAGTTKLMDGTRHKLRHAAAYLDRRGNESDAGLATALRRDAAELDQDIFTFTVAMLGKEKSVTSDQRSALGEVEGSDSPARCR